MEPITFCGMYDCGIDYLFSLSLPLIQAEYGDSHHLLSIDLSGLDIPETIETELSYLLSEYDSSVSGNLGYFGITSTIKKLSLIKPLHLSIYAGQEVVTDKSFLLLLNRLRNHLGWQFSYTLFLNAKSVLSAASTLQLDQKVIFRNLVWVLPLDKENAEVVVHNYEERYGFKLSKSQTNKIIELSGGNPGLIKSLYLIAKNKKLDQLDISDSKLSFRLHGIISDLGETKISPEPRTTILLTLGYTKQANLQLTWFTKLIDQYLKNSPTKSSDIPGRNVDQRLMSMTISQRKLMQHLEENQGKIVSRESIAQVIWGENWETKYSDWAIDQLISTLRKQMQLIKYEGKLVTKRGEGIALVSE